MPTGTVKSWDGYLRGGVGFVCPDDGGDEILVLYRLLLHIHFLVPGDRVEFELFWDANIQHNVCSYMTLFDDGTNTVAAACRARRNRD